MFYNLKIAIRNLRRDGLYSIINIVGLAISLTAVLLLSLWIWDELSYNKSFKRSEDISFLIMNIKRADNNDFWTQTSIPMAQMAKESIPEVEETCVVDPKFKMLYLNYGGKVFSGDSYCKVENTFFRVFQTRFIEGTPEHALSNSNSIVLTQSMAKKIFGNEPALGKALLGKSEFANEQQTYYVSAVIADNPGNTTFQQAVFCPFNEVEYEQYKQSDMWSFQTFFLLQPGSDHQKVAQSMTEVYTANNKIESSKFAFLLQDIKNMRLYDPSGKETGMASVRMFVWIALLLLFISCINYINLVTARAVKRNKEMCLKKTLGAKTLRIFREVMSESAILFLVSLLSALALAVALLPFYNKVTGKQLFFDITDPVIWIVLSSSFLLVTLMAGLYPAAKLSAFRLTNSLKKHQTKNEFSFRKILVVFQFVVTAGLIVSTIVINRQLDFILHKELGYDKEQIFSFRIKGNKDLQDHYDELKSDLEGKTSIAGVTAVSTNILDANKYAKTQSLHWEDQEEGQIIKVMDLNVDNAFFQTMRIPLVEGGGFTNTAADQYRFYLNEIAVKQMGLKDPLGKKVKLFDHEGIIAGIVNDFHFSNMNTTIEPVVMYLGDRSYEMVYVKAQPGNLPEALAATESIWKKYTQDIPFTYEFMDDTLNRMYQPEQQKSGLFSYFSLVAIFISCLGLFGLVTYTAETKNKEIGIRKVLGASISNIISLLSKEFLILVCIAIAIAFPLAYYWVSTLLDDYAYHVSISWWMFALAGLITIALTLLTVGWQAVKAATANPVKSIKTE